MYQIRINEKRSFSQFSYKNTQSKVNWPRVANLISIFGMLMLTAFHSDRVFALGESLPVQILVKQSDVYVTIDREKIVDYSLKRQQFHKGRAIQVQPENIKMFSIEDDGYKETFMIRKADDFKKQISDGVYSEKVTVNVTPIDYRNNDKPMVYDRWLYYQVDNGSIKYISPHDYSERVDPTYFEKNSQGKLQAYKKGGGLAATSISVISKPQLDIRVNTTPKLNSRLPFQFTMPKTSDRSELWER